MTKTENLNIRVSPNLRARLKAIADRLKALGYDTSESEVARTGIEKEVKRLSKIKRS